MNKRLKQLVETQPIRGGQILDCYNQAVSDLAVTITTRVDAANMIYIAEDMKLQLPSELTTRQGKRGKTKTCTVGEVVPYLPPKTCFFDIRHLVVDTDLLPFAVTTRINANNQQYLKELDMNDKKEPTIIQQVVKEPFVVASRGREPQCQRNMQTIIGSKQANAARANLNQVSPTLTEAMGMGGGQIPMLTDATIEETKSEQFMSQMRKPKDNMLCEPSFRIRKLTERECFRLMGCDEQTIDKIQASGVSRSQQYKLAGNSIVVDVLTAIFDKMFVHTEITELKLFY